ncbi:hypothetical protein ACEWY4_016360 [Coilia grayii]|uniref:GAIN-B domain-containing protein n=1 Tax=Coilia grayii TaxID=363190 RepID=A0ABD1JK89_9TELE
MYSNLAFQNASDKVLHDFACVFWDYVLRDWSTHGCFKGSISGSLQCHCNHTTNFAVLMSRQSSPTILLVSICVSMTIFYFLFLFGIENPNGKFKPNSTVSKENTLLSSDLHQEPDRGPCTALTALMQYFLLATFTWNTLYAVHIFILFKNTFSGPPRGFQASSIATGWGKLAKD